MLPYRADHLHSLGLVAFTPEARASLETISVNTVGLELTLPMPITSCLQTGYVLVQWPHSPILLPQAARGAAQASF